MLSITSHVLFSPAEWVTAEGPVPCPYRLGGGAAALAGMGLPAGVPGATRVFRRLGRQHRIPGSQRGVANAAAPKLPGTSQLQGSEQVLPSANTGTVTGCAGRMFDHERTLASVRYRSFVLVVSLLAAMSRP